MSFAFTEEVRDALLRTEALTEAAVGELALAATEQDIAGWSQSQFGEIKGIGKAGAFAAYTVIHRFVAQQGVVERQTFTIPERPPYLDQSGDYDPTDPAQRWLAPGTSDQFYRWDGKRHGRFAETWGQVRPVMEVEHINVQGVLVPNATQAREAIDRGLDWFHKGYGVWIGPGGKPYATVDPQKRMAVLRARDALDEGQVVVAGSRAA